MRRLLIAIASLLPTAVFADCNPALPDWQCVFKREDTHLIANQPARKFVEDDKVAEMISEADIFINNYYSTVKTLTGDLGMRGRALDVIADIGVMEAYEAFAIGAKLANDPYNLKTIYTDIFCQLYWDFAEGITGIARTCPTTAQLVLDAQQLAALDQRRREIQDIFTNPNLVLGEQWADLQTEVDLIRNKYDAVISFGKNVASADVEQRFRDEFSSYDEMLTQAVRQPVPMEQKIQRLSDMQHHTIRDTIAATGESSRQSFNEDMQELENLKDMSSRAVGRMQAVEIDNMLGIQKVQKWTKISEQVLNNNNLIAIDMGVDQTWTEEFRAQHEKMKVGIADPALQTNINDGTAWLR